MGWSAALMLVLAPALAHISGLLTVRRMTRIRANIADTIPGLSTHHPGDGTATDAARRFDRAVDETFDLLAKRLSSGGVNVRARTLAAELDVPVSVVATALDQLTDSAPYTMRVMDSGELSYEFAPGATGSIKGRTLLRWPARVAWFVTACVANFGSMWPSVFITATCYTVFASFLVTGGIEGALYGSVFAILGGLLGYWVLTRISGGLSRPLIATPDPGPPHGQEDRELQELDDDRQSDELGFFRARSGAHGVWKVYKSFFRGLFRGRGDKRGAIVLIAIATLLALLALAFVSASSWIGTLWKILSGRLPRLPEVAPGAWVREPQPVGSPFLELSDELALTLMAAVRRLVLDRRPRDEALAGRVVALAARQGGRVSGIDLILREGFDEAEAITVAARVTGQAGGHITVSEAGDVDCVFEIPVGANLNVEPAPLEAVELRGKTVHVLSDSIPVNVPGVNRYRLDAALNMATGAALAALALGVLAPSGVLGVTLFGVASAVSLCTWALVGASRYGSRESARAGLLRDARRGALALLRIHLKRSIDRLPRETFSSLVQTLDELDPDNGPEMVWAEIDLALSDAGVELAIDGEGDGALAYDLRPLRERLQSLENLRTQEVELGEEVELDEVVVFETSTVTS